MTAQVLTSVENIGQQIFQDYSESYAQLGHIVTDLPIVHRLPQTLSSLLPHDYRAVSLGSGDGKETKLFVEEARKCGKQGVFINVDPFINREDVLKITGEEFISNCKRNSLDLILLKCSFHFNKDQQTFFQNCHQCLKETGKIVIVQMGRQCQLPWTPTLQKNFQNLLLTAENHIPSELFEWERKEEIKTCRFNRRMFYDFVRQRGWSNLLTHTEVEINECLNSLASLEELPEAVLSIWEFVITKKSKQF